MEENMISNEFAVKLCLDHEVKRGNKVVKKELIVALRGEIYFVKFIINPEEDNVEPGVVLGRSFMRLTKGIADCKNKTITIYPKLDPFLDSAREEEKIGDDWDLLLDDLDFGDILDSEGVEIPLFVCKMGKSTEKEALVINIFKRYSLLEEERPVIKTMAYSDNYKKILDGICLDKMKLDGEIKKKGEETITKIEGKALIENKDLGAFVIPIQMEGQINLNALADTGFDINAEPMGLLKDDTGAHDDEAGSSRSKRSRQYEMVEEAMLPHVHHLYLLWEGCNQAARSRYNTRLAQLLLRLIYSPCVVDWNEIFTSEAWTNAFNNDERIYSELFHEFCSTYEFDEVCVVDELKTKKIIKFRLCGCAFSWTLLEFAKRLGLYNSKEIEEEGFDVYFQGGLRSDEHFNAQEYWLSISQEENLSLSKNFKELIEKVEARINDWKNKSLSIVGRLQLVQSVIASMHVYWASVFILSTCILLDIEQTMRGFLWCQGSMRKGKAKVAWDVVCLPKDEGGLGVQRLDLFNKALMAVHIWKLLTMKESLWVLQLRPCIREFIWHKIGDGARTSLWYDQWCSLSLLADFVSSRDMFRAGLNKSSKVADVLGSGSLVWSQELWVKYPSLLSISSPRLSLGIQDKLEWRLRSGSIKPFAVSMVWQSIRPRDVKVAWVDVAWLHMRDLASLSHLQPSLEVILDFIIPMEKRRTSNSVISKLVLAASVYFIWQERNDFQGWFGSHEALEARKDVINLVSMFTDGMSSGLIEVQAWLEVNVFIMRIAKRKNLLSEEVLNSLSALIYCRALDTTTLRELIDSEGRLIPEALEPVVPSVAILRPPRASMHDLYKRIGSMDIRQGVIERMSYREPITHLDMISSSMTNIISSTHLSSNTQMMMSSVE
ncbi:hypothetical protein Tco_0933743, partial [Tanacetum coccineum]